MAEVFLYADETGDLDLAGSPGTSVFFGFGTATFVGDHGDRLWEGFHLRCELEGRGVHLQRGFHAKNDSRATRSDVFSLIAEQAPRFDMTFLDKRAAYDSVKSRGSIYLYKMAVFLHLKWVIDKISNPLDTVFVIVGSLQTSRKREAVRHAVVDVCQQVSSARSRIIVPCIWDAPSSWGIQVADYGLWAVQRDLEGRSSEWLEPCVKPSLASLFRPWSRDEQERVGTESGDEE